MADKTWNECAVILSTVLDKKALDSLKQKYRMTSNSHEFLKDLLEILCSASTANYSAKHGDLSDGDIVLSSCALQIPVLFSSGTLFEAFKKLFQELHNADKGEQSWKLCTIISEIVKSCRLLWLLQINGAEDENFVCEISNFETSKQNIVSFMLFLFKNADLMPMNAEELRSHGKLKLFPGILLLGLLVLRKLCEDSEGISDNILRSLRSAVLRNIACNAVMVCIQQIGTCYWVSEISRKVASEFLEFVTSGCGCEYEEDLLSGSKSESSSNAVTVYQERTIFPNGLLGNILQGLKKFMTKEKFVESPVAIHILVWSIEKVKHPFLGKHISMILPPLLLLVDDYRVDNRVTGIQCLQHVVENVNGTELSWYGRAEVIYEALHHRIYTNEPQVMYVLQPCLLKVLKVIEPSPKKPIAHRKMNRVDHNFQIILLSMEFEGKIALRRAYCSHLVEFIDHMGITILRHFKCLLRVVFRYLEVPDDTTEEWRFVMLDVLKSIITNAWPRIPAYADDILKCLLKLVIDISTPCIISLDTKQRMLVKIEECLLVLMFCCGEPLKRQLETMATGLGHLEAENLISRTLASCQIQTE